MPYHSSQISFLPHHCYWLLPCSSLPSGKHCRTATLPGQLSTNTAFQTPQSNLLPQPRELFARPILYTNTAKPFVLPNPYPLHRWYTKTHVPHRFHQAPTMALRLAAAIAVHSSTVPILLFLPNTHPHCLQKSHIQNS